MAKVGITMGFMPKTYRALRRKFEKMGRNFNWEVGRALYIEGEQIMAESKLNWVPVRRGVLRASGHVLPPQAGPIIVMGYGGPAVDYAVVQHERLDYIHRVGRAKYLELPALKAASGLNQRVAKELRKRLKHHAAS